MINFKNLAGAGIGSGYGGNAEGIDIDNVTIAGMLVRVVEGYSPGGAGIGSGLWGEASDINIKGGNIDIKAQPITTSPAGTCNGAGIGSGAGGKADGVTIFDGKINVETDDGAGIGSGEGGRSCTGLLINGGVITASSVYGAAIGGGEGGHCEDVTVDGGTIDVQSRAGAGIGTGCVNSYNTRINISAGNISASSIQGAGIGGGPSADCDGITISGGIVDAKSGAGAGIGSGNLALRAQNITVSGGFVNASSDGSSAYGIGTSYAEARSFNIRILGGSIVANASEGAIGNKWNSAAGEETFEINLPADADYADGKTIGFYSNINNDEVKYNLKTVSGSGKEHGESYTSAATVYLPEGTHLMEVGGVPYGTITVSNDGTYDITKYTNPVPSVADTSTNQMSINPESVYRNQNFTITATSQAISSTQVGDQSYVPSGWSVEKDSGNFTEAGGSYSATHRVIKTGTYDCYAKFEKKLYDETKWLSTGTYYTTSTTLQVMFDADESYNEISVPPKIYNGVEFRITAKGDSPGENPGDGESAYFPSSWAIGTNSGSFNCTATVPDASTIIVPQNIYAGKSHTVKAPSIVPASPVAGDQAYFSQFWAIGTTTGNIENDIGTFKYGNTGTHYLMITYYKYEYTTEHGWLQAAGSETRSISITITTDPGDNNEDGDKKDDDKVVPPTTHKTTSIKSAQKNIYLKKGQSVKLPFVEYTTDGSKSKLTWKSGKKSVVTVSASGKVKARKKGSATITVKAPNGKYLKFKIYVSTKTTKTKKVNVKYSKTMKVGATKFLKVTISPKKATKAIATFKSSKPGILSVDKAGKLIAKKKGTAKITVKAGGKKKVVTIKVK